MNDHFSCCSEDQFCQCGQSGVNSEDHLSDDSHFHFEGQQVFGCGPASHAFEKFSDTHVVCRNCGEFRSAPSDNTWRVFPTPYPWVTSPNTWTVSDGTSYSGDLKVQQHC